MNRSSLLDLDKKIYQAEQEAIRPVIGAAASSPTRRSSIQLSESTDEPTPTARTWTNLTTKSEVTKEYEKYVIASQAGMQRIDRLMSQNPWDNPLLPLQRTLSQPVMVPYGFNPNSSYLQFC